MISCSKEKGRATILEGMTSEIVTKNKSNRTISPTVESSSTGIKVKVVLSVVYMGDLEKIMSDEASIFKKTVDAYKLNLIAPFEVDEEMKGIVLESFSTLENPIELAKKISIADEVLMVEVKESYPDNF